MNRQDVSREVSGLEDFLLKGNLNLLPATFLDEKDTLVISRVASIMRYWPDEDLNPSILLSLLRLPKEFKKIRSLNHIRRVICAEFFYKKRVIKAIDQYPHKRHLFVKLLKTQLEFPFGVKSVLGIAVSFNLMKAREAFEEGHILEAVRHTLPDVRVVRGSFIDSIDKKNQIYSAYLEIEKEVNPDFTLDEIKRLQKSLPHEFKGCIEELVPVTFMRRNEEEVYRNILSLRGQLKSIRDIPQATITFEEQTQFDLFFTVVLLRVIRENARPLQSIFEREHPKAIFIPDRVDTVGLIGKKYKKEATVFRLQLAKNEFYRKDRSVNLYKARQRVLEMLESALGPIRDYNGGLILKQNERLADFLSLMPQGFDEFFLENFFYSITPIAMQSILPAILVKEWFTAFSELLKNELGRKQAYLLLSRKLEDAFLTIVRAEDSTFKEGLIKEINQLGIPSLELAFAEINMHGAFCFGFLYRPSLVGLEADFYKIVKEYLEKWSESVSEKQSLRIAVHGNEPCLDPRVAKKDHSCTFIKMLFEGLARIGLNGQPELAIAESYTVSTDYKTYCFHLRESCWSNGMPITAHDFEYTWKKALDPRASSNFCHTLYLIKNGRRVKAGMLSMEEVGIKALDEKTLLVELEYPAPYFLEVAAHWTYSLINSAIDQKYPDWAFQAGENYVSNGPFKLVEWKHSRTITVEKNPFYWDAERVKLKKISISMIESFQSNVGMLTRGEVDILGHPLSPFPANITGAVHEDIEKNSFAVQGVLSICFNVAQFPFNHKKIRQAFAYAINREPFEKLSPQEFGGESYSLLPKALSLNSERVFPSEDTEKARLLFREGLGEIGFVKSDFPRLTLCYCNGLHRLPLLKMLCKQWKEAFGIEIYLKNYERGEYLNQLHKGKFQLACTDVTANWSDPLHLLEVFEDKNDPLNIGAWENPAFQKWLKIAKSAPTIEERNQSLKQAELILGQQIPAIPLYQLAGSYLKKRGIANFLTSETFQADFKWVFKQ